MVGKVESSQLRQHVALPLPLLDFRRPNLKTSTNVRRLVRKRIRKGTRSDLGGLLRRRNRRTVLRPNAPAEVLVNAAVPAEAARLVLVPVERNDEDTAVWNRVEVEETNDRVDHVGFDDPVEDKVLVDAEASFVRVALFRARARSVGARVVVDVRAEVGEGREVAFVLEEEAKVAEGLAGRVAGREVVAEDAVENESVALGVVGMDEGRRKGMVVRVGDWWSGDEKAVLVLLLQWSGSSHLLAGLRLRGVAGLTA